MTEPQNRYDINDPKSRKCERRAFCLGLFINGQCPSCGYNEDTLEPSSSLTSNNSGSDK